MRKFAFIFFLLFITFLNAQAWVIDSILEMKAYGVEEKEILKFLKGRKIEINLNSQNLKQLKNGGFSQNFIDKLKSLQKSTGINNLDKKEKSFKIYAQVKPKGAGKIIFTPSPNFQGEYKKGTMVTIKPKAKDPYLFDYWQGDFNGYSPIKIKINKNLNIIACFKKVSMPTPPPKINNAKAFKDTRLPGHIYEGDVIGKVSGRAENKDWGISGEVNFNYLYQVHYNSSVISNDGFRIVEKRHFSSVKEILMASKIKFHIDIRQDLQWVKKFLDDISSGLLITGYKEIGIALKLGTKMADRSLESLEKVQFSGERIKKTIDSVGKFVGQKGLYETLKRAFINTNIGTVLGYSPQMKLLEGKTFRLVYEDGVGLIKVEILDKNKTITAKEKELIQRAFYLSDYYIFKDSNNPDREIKVGDSWQVDARNLAGVLDPRLKHQAKGTIQLSRKKDITDKNSKKASFSIIRGIVRMSPYDKKYKLTGSAYFNKGEILYDLVKQYVTSADLSGTIDYKQVSKDHLFFKTRIITNPTINIQYRCKCVQETY